MTSLFGPAARRAVFFLGCCTYACFYQLFFIDVVSVVEGDFGYSFTEPEMDYWIIFTLFALAPSLWMPLEFRRPSQFIHLMLYIILYIPICYVPLFTQEYDSSPAELLPLVSGISLCMAAWSLVYRLPLIRIPELNVSPRTFWAGGIFTCLTTLLVLHYYYGGRLHLASLLSPYEQRGISGDILAKAPGFVGYFVSLQSRVFSPFLICSGLWKRRPSLVFAGGLIELYVFSMTANREGFMSIAITCCLYIYFRAPKRSLFVLTVWGISFIVGIGTLASLVSDSEVVRSMSMMVLWRTTVIPAKITGLFYRFFSQAGFTHFFHVSGFSLFGQDPYGGKPLGFVVGEFAGTPNANANGNFWADGFASEGFFGLAFVTILLIILCHIADSVLSEKDLGYATAFLGRYTIPLANTSIFTVFLGGGLGFMLLLNLTSPKGYMNKNGSPHLGSSERTGS